VSYLLVCLVALIASGLTLVSGFGLGTLLLPAFALFFPIEIAISATAVVHLANNVFKLALIGRQANGGIVLRFGLPAIVGAMLGGWTLKLLSGSGELFSYQWLGRIWHVETVQFVVALMIGFFAALELRPSGAGKGFPPSVLSLGGIASGFFGGLSGHQGALRSAFLVRSGLSKQSFIGTGVVCAVFVDLARLAVYGAAFSGGALAGARAEPGLVLSATLAAFGGAFIGKQLLGKVTWSAVHRVVAVTLLLLSLGMALGLV
jgi:uncharacterized membrane protein YfcA